MVRELKVNDVVYFAVIDRLQAGTVLSVYAGTASVRFYTDNSPFFTERRVLLAALYTTPEAWRDVEVEGLRATLRRRGRGRAQLCRNALRVDARLFAYWVYMMTHRRDR